MRPAGEYGNAYGRVYDDYKFRLENHPKYGVVNDADRRVKPKGKGEEAEGGYAPALHRHNMAVRYMIKIFLLDLYKAWRAMEGLVVEPPYHEAKLGIYHKSPSDQRA